MPRVKPAPAEAVEVDVRLGIGQERAEEARRRGAIPCDFPQQRLDATLHRLADARGLARGLEIGIAVTSFECHAVAQMVEERLRDSMWDGGAEADRIGDARVQRDAVVRIGGRQVQHVAGRQDHVVRRREPAQDLDRKAGPQRKVVLAAVSPAAAAVALQQEYVVGIEVRPDAAAGCRIAHHQVVEARVREERKSAGAARRRHPNAGWRPAPAASSPSRAAS